MKKKFGILFLLILLFGGGVAVKFLVLDQQPSEGKLKVFSSPSASIFLNNEPIGKTPYEETKPTGEYILKLIPEGTAPDVASWQGKVTIYKKALTFVDRELGSSDLTSAGVIFNIIKMSSAPKKKDVGEIEAETEPSGAIVYLNNDEKGIAPLILSDVPKGEHELSVYVPGFFRRTQKVNVESLFRTSVKFKLALDQSQKKIEDITDEEATESAEENKNNNEKSATSSATKTKIIVEVKDTPTGWLRVREEPTIIASETAKVNPKDIFTVLDEQNGWYKIEYEKGKEGWISAQYTVKKSE
ncbi:MAG TPA: PEGA domain-containing protein [Patescibacteria group bacterium]|nr:PEGA domain-containing protein [Patescibacteria group bacterium]